MPDILTLLLKMFLTPTDTSKMNVKNIIAVFITLLPFLAMADNSGPNDQFYKELLEKHQQGGHLNKRDVEEQHFKISKDKNWQNEFKEQVRGVASSLTPEKETIKLKNPAIEISVK